MSPRYPIIILSLLLITSFFSCVGTAPIREVRFIDSLNQRAYAYRYKNLDSSFCAAWMAYEEASFYRQGKAEACNNLGFCAFMQMNFDVAERLFHEVYNLTQNELELLIADVGLMKIYQRTAMNKEFYDYRNNAIRRIRRIDEDRSLFIDIHEKIRLNYAYTEFSIVSAIYYYYLQQMPEAMASINEIRPEIEFENDTSQLLYYHYIKGATSLAEDETRERRKLNEFDELLFTWRLASQGGYTYFEGNGLQGLANLMVAPDDFDFFLERRSHAMSQFGIPIDSLFPLELARMALVKFKEYNDIYQIAGAYVSIGRYFNEHGCYEEALDSLARALDYVNQHHTLYYANDQKDAELLYPYVERDTFYTEAGWITGMEDSNGSEQGVKTVPEWISRIREQLSVAYAGLGMINESYYNRNIYLEILKVTRQDKELESRSEVLKRESKLLNVLLLLILFALLVLVFLFWVFNKRSKKRNNIYISRLRLTLDICQKVTGSIPSDIASEDDMIHSIKTSILPDMKELVGASHLDLQLFNEGHKENSDNAAETPSETKSVFYLSVPDKESPIGMFTVFTSHRLTKDEQTLIRVIVPYIAWTLDNGMTFISLSDEQEKLEKQRYIFEQHIAKNKRENIIKKSCLAIVNGIVPYIDRIINEVYKLKEKSFFENKEVKQEKYQYIDELVTTINEYNDILALWIKMKQGSINLNIENFELNELFALVAKGRKTFEMRRQTFEVESTEAVVKADKALTLFMINTLTENARKYTPEGGKIKVYARTTNEYVEISVEDNGRGLSPSDIAMIKDEKIYDSRLIGMGNKDHAEELKRVKGNGFGLMNCRGIIEKYRKTNKIFAVCMFSVESALGEGSRFFFRLPLGIRKKLGILLCLLLPLGITSCNDRSTSAKEVLSDSPDVVDPMEYDRLLEDASLFADTAFYCNVIAEYDLALQYIDSAMSRINYHYQTYALNPHVYLTLTGEDDPAELIWWNELFDTDYRLINYLRNEAAFSFLSLKKWSAYSYNNRAYTTLFKLRSEDQSLDAYCRELERSTTNKIVGIILCIILLVFSLIGYYIVYIRKRITNRWNLEQVLEINKKVFFSSLIRPEESVEALQREENALREIPRKIVYEAFDSVNELMSINCLGLAVYNESRNKLEFASYPDRDSVPEIVRQSYEEQTFLEEMDNQVFPLIIEVGDKQQCVGVLYLERQEGIEQETDRLLFELISRYLAIVIFNAVVKLAMRYRDIESAYEDTYRASREDSMLHVQNMVLDNCLSTIKHETIYYPNKIKQIIGKLTDKKNPEEEEKENIDAIEELIDYYKGIFTILSSNASRQLEDVTFRRTTIPVSELLMYAEKFFKKVSKTKAEHVSLEVDYTFANANVLGDKNQLFFLFENLIEEALSARVNGNLRLQTGIDGYFVRFLFIDTRREKSVEELNQLFYPDLNRMTSGDKGDLKGTEYLVCKQIIRDHDEFAGRRGCRINAEPSYEGGFTVYFTIPKKDN